MLYFCKSKFNFLLLMMQLSQLMSFIFLYKVIYIPIDKNGGEKYINDSTIKFSSIDN